MLFTNNLKRNRFLLLLMGAMLKPQVLLVLILILFPLGVAFALIVQSSEDPPSYELRIFAAASLYPYLEKIKADFGNDFNQIKINFAGSNTLSSQILLGVPADLFLSANSNEMNKIEDAGFIVGGSKVFASNHIVLLVSKSSSFRVNTIDDLTQPKIRLVVADQSVPLGQYTAEILSRIDNKMNSNQTNNGNFGNFSSLFYQNIISFEPDAAKVVQKIVTGVADAGFAYYSDYVYQTDYVNLVKIPGELTIAADYYLGILSTSNNFELTEKFVEFILSEEGQLYFNESGFIAD